MNTASYDLVVILFNPNSTGPSEQNAKELKAAIEERSQQLRVELVGTDYARHGEELAREYAESGERLLLVSSSGDGGYNELLNGVLNAADGAAGVTVSLIPSGNANDHYSAVQSGDYVDAVVRQNTQVMDVIKVVGIIDGKRWVRYAHSYVGFGVSAHIGRRLTKAKLNVWNEKLIVLKGLLAFRYVRLVVDGAQVKYSSLVISNIDRMSKVLKLSGQSAVDDGKLEVNEIEYRSVMWTIISLLKMLVRDISSHRTIRHARFTTAVKTPIQIDGEDFVLDAESNVVVEVVERAVRYVA